MNIRTISYVVPCYNEEEVLPEFYRRVSVVADSHPDYEFEFVFVNDGSIDRSPDILNDLADKDPRAKVLHFARNQGHQAAITAGMDFSSGDLIVIIDADLQDPPELIDRILEKVNQGFDVVHMQRNRRAGESWFKLITASGFYRLMNYVGNSNIVENCGDFRAFTRPVLKTIQGFREQHRFMRGLFAMVGFRQAVIQYDRDSRHAGKTKYSLHKMIYLASNAVLSFSATPLHSIAWLSFFLWFISLVYLCKALIDHFVFEITVQGWTSIIILMTFYTGIVIFCLSIIATYIGRIFEQGQQRPLYWLYDVRNIERQQFDLVAREVQLSNDIIISKEDT
jgi:dolichol-phosphate mannosyltransferase